MQDMLCDGVTDDWPKLWQSRILCGSAQAYAVLSDPEPPFRSWFNFDYMNLDAEADSDSEGLVLA